MKYLWNWIDKLPIMKERKYNVCLWISSILLALLGCGLYAVLNLAVHLENEWLLILTGWPVILGWIAVFLYGCRHPFR